METYDLDILRSLSNERLHVIVLPTEACNFRCVYCYEEFRYKRMDPWVVEGLKRLLARRAATLSELSLSWFGGEPTLAADIVLDVMREARRLATSHPGLRLSSDMTTNGFLLQRPLFDRLLEAGVQRYQVTFDGPRQWHDRKRVRHGGRRTFDRIWGNLLAMRDSNSEFTILLRIHADADNYRAIPAFLEDIDESFGRDPRFEVFIRMLSRLGGPVDDDLPVLPLEEGRGIVERLRAAAARLGLPQVGVESGRTICYAAQANSLVLRSNGRLNKCTVALEHPHNQVGRLLEDGTLQIEKGPMIQWMRGLRSGDSAELKCPKIGWADAPKRIGALLIGLRPGEVSP